MSQKTQPEKPQPSPDDLAARLAAAESALAAAESRIAALEKQQLEDAVFLGLLLEFIDEVGAANGHAPSLAGFSSFHFSAEKAAAIKARRARAS